MNCEDGKVSVRFHARQLNFQFTFVMGNRRSRWVRADGIAETSFSNGSPTVLSTSSSSRCCQSVFIVISPWCYKTWSTTWRWVQGKVVLCQRCAIARLSARWLSSRWLNVNFLEASNDELAIQLKRESLRLYILCGSIRACDSGHSSRPRTDCQFVWIRPRDSV